jgi:hypothetical protein
MHSVITMQVVSLDRRPVTDRISPAALFPERVEPLRPRRGNAECFGCVGVVGQRTRCILVVHRPSCTGTRATRLKASYLFDNSWLPSLP